MPNILISIVTYNTPDKTLSCLSSIEKLNVKNFKYKVLVVDNNSTVPFTATDNKFSFDLQIIRQVNTGFSGGHNTSLRYARKNKFDYVLVLNSDTVLDENLLVNLVESFATDSTIIAVTPKIYFKKGSEFHKDRYKKEELGKVIWYAGAKMNWETVMGEHIGVDKVDIGQFNEPLYLEQFTGCCVLLKLDLLQEVGYFDDKYFLYFEDVDLSFRIRNKGYRIYYNPKAFMWHENAGSTGGSGSYLQDYYITRNRMIFSYRYASFKTKLFLVKQSISLLFKGRKWQKRGIIDFYLGRLYKGSFKV